MSESVLEQFPLTVAVAFHRYEQWQPSGGTAICVEIIRLFAKLEDVVRFLNPVIEAVIALETSMSRFQASPFRAPTVEYLTVYAADATTLFLSKFDDPTFFNFYKDVLELPSGGQLRDALLPQLAELSKVSLEHAAVVWANSTDAEALTAADRLFYQGVAIIRVLSDHTEGARDVVTEYLPAVFSVWDQVPFFERLAAQRSSPYIATIDLTVLMQLQVSFVSPGVNEDATLIMGLLRAFNLTPPIDAALLFKFFAIEVATKYTPSSRCEILSRLVAMCADDSVEASMRSHAIQKLGIPILAAAKNTSDVLAVLGTGSTGFIAKWVAFLRQATALTDDLQLSILQLTVSIVRMSSGGPAASEMESEFTDEIKQALLDFGWHRASLGEIEWDTTDISVK
jgi:hypothetical protein